MNKKRIYFILEGCIETNKNILDITIKEFGELIKNKPQIISRKVVSYIN